MEIFPIIYFIMCLQTKCMNFGRGRFFKEETAYDPHSPYSASKASSVHFVRAFADTCGLPTVIFNCSNNYGSYQFPEKLIPLCINNIVQNKPLSVYGKGENVRDWYLLTIMQGPLMLFFMMVN